MNSFGFCCPLAMPRMDDPSRRRIYEYLSQEGEKTVAEITQKIKLRQPTVSYHLKSMKKEGLLNSRKAGRAVFYSVRMVCPEGGGCFGG